MHLRHPIAFVAALLLAPALALAQYFPGATWEHRTPAQAGFDAARLKEGIDFAIAAESRNPRDMAEDQRKSFGRIEPMADIIGPMKPRGDMTGVLVHKGYIVAEWGEPARVDMSHSITKSFLSTVVGLAFDRGMIASLDDPVIGYVPPIVVFGQPGVLAPFDAPRNRDITWDHLLRQTSDWEGTLWGKPDWVDRPGRDADKNRTRARAAPGTTWKYNDVRVNLLSLAALDVWRRPLPQVLKESVMDPIGASNTWRWFGYENSFVVMDGEVMQSVSGGGHWGGGMFISAYDMARFGLLTLREGRWKERQILSKRWLEMARTPTGPNTEYGFMNYFLNGEHELLPNASTRAYAHIGNGNNMIIVDPDHDIVLVLRWIDTYASADEVLKRVVGAMRR
jgi:CubicO group peptidase (beta-lactamase class C family)